jgi:hypothetical protein
VPAEQLCGAAVVAAYKRLSRVEDAFRSLKSVDLQVRPIYHRLEERVRAHAFLCLLAEYLVFHLRAAWAPLTFGDEEKDAPRADAVAKAQRGDAAEQKARTQRTADGGPLPQLPFAPRAPRHPDPQHHPSARPGRRHLRAAHAAYPVAAAGL